MECQLCKWDWVKKMVDELCIVIHCLEKLVLEKYKMQSNWNTQTKMTTTWKLVSLDVEIVGSVTCFSLLVLFSRCLCCLCWRVKSIKNLTYLNRKKIGLKSINILRLWAVCRVVCCYVHIIKYFHKEMAYFFRNITFPWLNEIEMLSFRKMHFNYSYMEINIK